MHSLTRAITALAVATLPIVVFSSASTADTVPTCYGQPATIVGTSGEDRLVGQSGVTDVIVGLGGNDYISGGAFYQDDEIPGAAPDYLCGGPGDDEVYGSPGSDHLAGGGGNDVVKGWDGNDVEQGNDGADRVGTTSFADSDSSDDISRGGAGPDVMLGGFGHDRLYGGPGPDQLFDDECDATLMNGNGGDDYLESWWSSYFGEQCSTGEPDTVIGGYGTDTAKVNAIDSVRTVEDVTLMDAVTLSRHTGTPN